ncbi:MAG: hypothetical protein U1F53_10540 [Burkholderiaceae bacterium]
MLGYQVAELPPGTGAFLDLNPPRREPVAREALRRHLVDPAVPYRTSSACAPAAACWSW